MSETKTHWKKSYNPNYFGAWCFEPGKDMVLTISGVMQELVRDESGKEEQCMVIRWREAGAKPLICNKTNAKAIEKLVGSPYIEDWPGNRLQLYIDPNVRFGRERVGGVRIRPRVTMANDPAPILCEECGKAVLGVGNYTAQQVAATNKARYGVVLCAVCSAKRKAMAQAGQAAQSDIQAASQDETQDGQAAQDNAQKGGADNNDVQADA